MIKKPDGYVTIINPPLDQWEITGNILQKFWRGKHINKYNFDYESDEFKQYINDLSMSAMFDNCTRILNETCSWWGEENQSKIFTLIYEYLSKDNSIGVCTQLFPFEVYLLNNGYEYLNFSKLNFYDPERSLKSDNDIIYIKWTKAFNIYSNKYIGKIPDESQFELFL